MAKNKTNGKIYIGQTVRKLYDRKSDHHLQAKNNCDSMPFHRAIRKYGKTGFEWHILADNIDDVGELNRLEKHYIAQYKSLSPNGYNLQQGGWNGYHHEETKRKMSIARKGMVYEQHHARSISAIVRDERQRVAHGHSRHTSLRDSMRMANGCSVLSRDKAIKNIIKRITPIETIRHGYYIKQKGDPIISAKKKQYSDEYRAAARARRIANGWTPAHIRKPCICLETMVSYDSVGKAAKDLGLHDTDISKVCKGKQLTLHGLHFQYI